MAQKIYQVDSFTDKPFAGNPAGVFIMDAAADEDWMQSVAAEMNLSETAFLYPKGDGFSLRWFTPTMEVELCGHATLASAHILWEQEFLGTTEAARFHTLSGLLTASLDDGWIMLDFPSVAPRSVEAPPGLFEALGARGLYVGRNEWSYLVEVESEKIVRNLSPDFAALSRLNDTRVIVTSRSEGDRYDFVSRFFAPSIGIDEDPVTGSAHCCLGPYWMDRLGKDQLMAYQASKRGGEVRVHVVGERVHLYGQAVTVFEAILR